MLKWGTLGSNRLKCTAKRSSIHAASKVAKVGAAGGPKLLKWGRLRGRGRVKSAK